MIDIRYQPDDLVITIPRRLASSAYVQEFLERVRVDAILAASEATEEQIRTLADQTDADWWAANRDKFTGEDPD
jgi:hypothetical protein